MRLLRLWPDESHVDFMRFRRFTFPLSAFLSVATVVLFLTVGLNFGIDFKGGTLVELQAKSKTADVGAVRHTANGFGFGETEVQELGGEGTVLVRFPLQPGEQGQTAVMQKAHAAFDADYVFRRTETVGPRVSGELVQSGTIGVVLSVLAVLFYLWFRFERELALGAIVGTLHDIVLTLGVFVISRIEFNMTSIAAILTIVGYSLNETVVVFDRTRELMRRYKTIPTVELLNLSINSTMSRTVMTATSAFLSLLALVLFGGEAIKGFAIVMLAGVVICTYSAIFVSTPVLIYLGLMLSGVKAQGRPAGGRVPQAAE
ncbi:preprotein translocase subunit SecF [Methylobacterium sp. Leaf125]|jgi:preprotein translocase subunit SecF|uniref:protein translocase subunit SecF n=1 Tax=unclassified Methylobacterium TaxID=2615210 RepID=UPI0006F6B7FB|nr:MULTISPECIES: protein translocase subunit SecF [unclassified Methylobacterium]KQQ47040.1 preprotein translocase subunit SecF [Methylobacterium sp. Leaf125]POR43276.1 protein translocase subunit SecF [Methylobacterium sp. V23]